MQPGDSDRDLVDRFLRKRSESAFRRIYRRHTPMLYRIVWRVHAHRAEVDDIIQETWLRAVQGMPGFRWRSGLSTWLVGIALNRIRETRRTEPRTAGPGTPGPTEPASPSPDHENRLDLERAIACLPPGYREVLVLHAIEGFTHKEISMILDIDEGTSKSQLHHARRSVLKLCPPTGSPR